MTLPRIITAVVWCAACFFLTAARNAQETNTPNQTEKQSSLSDGDREAKPDLIRKLPPPFRKENEEVERELMLVRISQSIRKSKLYLGLGGGMGISMSQFARSGMQGEFQVAWRLHQYAGVFGTMSAGKLSTRAYGFKSGDYLLSLRDGNNLAHWQASFGLEGYFAALPHIETSLGLGIAALFLDGSTFAMSQTLGVTAIPGFWYSLFKDVSIGLQIPLTWYAVKAFVLPDGTRYDLDSAAFASDVKVLLSFRYLIF